MLRAARLSLVSGFHVIILFAKGGISLEALVALNLFPEMNEVRDKLVHVYIVGMICLIGQVSLLHDEKNHVGML